MPTWLIEPIDSLIVRDGRPFGADPGARAATLNFPFPSTLVGAVRNRAGLDQHGLFDRSRINHVQKLVMRGPLLVERRNDGRLHWFAPAPADALVLAADGSKEQIIVRQLVPRTQAATDASDLDGNKPLHPVGLQQRVKQKPLAGPPQFWHWPQFLRWLKRPEDVEQSETQDKLTADALGIGRLPLDQRTHVSIDEELGHARDGALFQTSALSFINLAAQEDQPAAARRLALVIDVAEKFQHFNGGIAALGGERRLVSWQHSSESLPEFDADLRKQIIEQQACRLILMTPALFDRGFLPERLLQPRDGITPILHGVALGRTPTVSGWDMELGKPKPTRRAAPAGAVYFLSFQMEDTPAQHEALGRWLDQHWLRPINDHEQDDRDGFGLAVFGSWDGKLPPLGGEHAA